MWCFVKEQQKLEKVENKREKRSKRKICTSIAASSSYVRLVQCNVFDHLLARLSWSTIDLLNTRLFHYLINQLSISQSLTCKTGLIQKRIPIIPEIHPSSTQLVYRIHLTDQAKILESYWEHLLKWDFSQKPYEHSYPKNNPPAPPLTTTNY